MFIMEELRALSQTYQLSVYEKVRLQYEKCLIVHAITIQVGSVYLHPDLFSPENGLMTQSGTLKRRVLEEYFKPQIEMMYKNLP